MVTAPITMSKGPRGAARWRKGGGPWKYGKPPINFEPAPKDLQHKHGLTRADLPVYAAHRPAAFAQSADEHHYMHVKDGALHADIAAFYTHHGDVVMNTALRTPGRTLDRRYDRNYADQLHEVRAKLAELGTEESRVRNAAASAAMHGMTIADKQKNATGEEAHALGIALAAQQKIVADSFSRLEKLREEKPALAARSRELEAQRHEQVDMTAEGRALAGQLDKYIAQRTLKQDMTLYRGMLTSIPLRNALREGSVWTDKGFVSTTGDKETARQLFGNIAFAEGNKVPVIMEIRVRKGQHAAYMEGVTNYKNEYEFLLPRGSRFRVLTAKKKAGTLHAVLEVV